MLCQSRVQDLWPKVFIRYPHTVVNYSDTYLKTTQMSIDTLSFPTVCCNIDTDFIILCFFIIIAYLYLCQGAFQLFVFFGLFQSVAESWDGDGSSVSGLGLNASILLSHWKYKIHCNVRDTDGRSKTDDMFCTIF